MPSYDVLVVGAGPAGGATALAAARAGARVLCIERHNAVGVPVQCAEHIPALLVGQMDLGASFIVQSTRGMKFFLPGSPVRETAMPGFVVNRDHFDQCLIQAAIDAGAELMTATQAIRRMDDDTILLRRKSGQSFTVKAGVIVGADGPRSLVGRWVGSVNQHLLSAMQITMPLAAPMEHTEVYFDRDYYAGYGWLFPKKDIANVGIGLKKCLHDPKHLRTKLDDLAARLSAEGKIRGAPVSVTYGWIPAGPVRKAAYGNVILVGDAAGHTHPITGAGIFMAVTCGQMAGKWAAIAAKEKDMRLLLQYDTQWRDLFEDTLTRACQHRITMEDRWEQFPEIIKSCWEAYRVYDG
jgi:geranylgeranyl reductase family protein